MRYRHFAGLVVGVALLSLLGSVAYAGIVPATVKVELANNPEGGGPPPWAGPPDFVFELVPGNAHKGMLRLQELFGGPEPLSLAVSGVANNDPTIDIVKSVTNQSGLTWFGYKIDLDTQQAATFTGTATSDVFTLVSQTPFELVFGLPSPVLNGQTVTFDFDVAIPSGGPFAFTVTQQPITTVIPLPTAAWMGLIGLGTVLVGSEWLKRRHRKA